MAVKTVIMDSESMSRALMRITHEIIERNKGVESLCLIGIRRRGVPLSHIIKENIYKVEGERVPVGELDITMYRDDLGTEFDAPVMSGSDIPFDVTGKKIVLVDDVIYTGRTARAAMDAVFSMGRPASLQLAELIDRGHRELPIRPDFVGKNIPTSKEEIVSVNLPEYDNDFSVVLLDGK